VPSNTLRISLRVVWLSCIGWPLTTLTTLAGQATFAAPEQVAAAHTGTGAIRVLVALLVVIGAVVAAGRFARRMRGFGGGSGSAGLEMLGQLPVGPRERAVLIRVGGHQLLLGVAPGQVRTLHVFEDLLPVPVVSSDPAAARPTFKSVLLKSLGK
jgi:flagellar protein FliO/FliZ